MVPLVFKTSLGVVRSPEGSTPSLLRHNRRELLLRYGALPANRVFRGTKIFIYNGRKNPWDPLPGKRVRRGEYDSSINDYSFLFWPVKIGCGLPTAFDRSGRCPRRRRSISPRVNTRRMEPRLGWMDGVNRFADDLEENR